MGLFFFENIENRLIEELVFLAILLVDSIDAYFIHGGLANDFYLKCKVSKTSKWQLHVIISMTLFLFNLFSLLTVAELLLSLKS